MPPKQQSKVELAKKQKVVEDKTFGLKNKNKSKNVQKYVQSLQQTVQPKPDASKIAAKASCLLALFVPPPSPTIDFLTSLPLCLVLIVT